MTETHIDILRLIADHQSLGRAELLKLIGVDPKTRLFRLRADKLISGHSINAVMTYSITDKGKRLLASIDKVKGDIAAPRQVVSKEPYRGEKWNTRPGSEPHAGYRRPMLIASNVLPMKGVL